MTDLVKEYAVKVNYVARLLSFDMQLKFTNGEHGNIFIKSISSEHTLNHAIHMFRFKFMDEGYMSYSFCSSMCRKDLCCKGCVYAGYYNNLITIDNLKDVSFYANAINNTVLSCGIKHYWKIPGEE